MAQGGIGESIRRKEDERLLNGHGLFIADVVVPGMLHAAFVRSPHAHARVKAVRKPRCAEDHVFVAADLKGVKPIRSSPNFPNFKHSDFPVLAIDKVRYAGEAVAMAVAETGRSEEHTSELQSQSISYAVFCLKKKKKKHRLSLLDIQQTTRLHSYQHELVLKQTTYVADLQRLVLHTAARCVTLGRRASDVVCIS